jgi:2-oxoglutarate dehydrogenase E1 component
MTTLRASPPSINGWNAEYLDAQYQAYKSDPASIAPELVPFFQGFDLAMASPSARGGGAPADAVGLRDALRFHVGVTGLVNAYRTLGHLAAKIDPFGRPRTTPRPPELSLGAHGLTDADLGKAVGGVAIVQNAPGLPKGTLGELAGALESIYCGSVGAEFMHIADKARREWFTNQFESLATLQPRTPDEHLAIYDLLFRAEGFERFLQKRYPGDKRFSIEGGESMIPILETLLQIGADLGVEEVVMGMAHRGRLTILNTVLGKSYEQIFTEFQDATLPNVPDGGGDVKYHKGYSGERTLRTGKRIHVAMASNPSHLEAVDPVVVGRARAKQRLRNDTERAKVVPFVLHGDAAVIGQGVMPELMNMSQLPGYTVGGTIHIVANNQIGFTTLPEDGRSGPYCTDQALSIGAPILHVNAEDPDMCVAVAHLSMLYRQTFKRDMFIDMNCYRKYGHNEQDEPSFTQPLMADLIKKMPSVVSRYGEKLVSIGAITRDGLERHKAELDSRLETAQKKAIEKVHAPDIDPGGKRWSGIRGAYSHSPVPTAVTPALIEEVCAAWSRLPQGFSPNPKASKILADRAAIPTTKAISYADGEMLAIGTLLLEGHAIRISGEDVRRGTFSHRHAVLTDTKVGEVEAGRYIPLNHMRPMADKPDDAGKPGPEGKPLQARLCVHDSCLSEYAVMGFEYGYSLADPNMLVMWEAQFGDFANGAQIIIDQFIASGEHKWARWSGLVLLLPHGQEGLGPEHSSARLERFLQLCGNDNMQVVAPSTGAQIFHLLRRQVSKKRTFRKPLIVMAPKSLLKVTTSTVDELTSGTFQEILDDPLFAKSGGDRKKVTRVLLCFGKMYHELAARRDAVKRTDTALIRVEQFYPFHAAMFKEILARYPASAQVVCVQEETRNNGMFQFLYDVLCVQPDPTQTNPDKSILSSKLAFIGRSQSCSPSGGSKSMHKFEQEAILTAAIGPDPSKADKPESKVEAKPGANGSHASPSTPGSHAAKAVKSKK